MRIPIEDPQRKIENGPAGKRPARMRNAKPGSVGAKFIHSKREGGNQQDADPQVIENTHLEKEPEFSPEEMKAIKDMAYYISERRMAGEGSEARERQKELAKEYGLDENIFSKEAINKLLSDNEKGKWTPEAEEFMQKWDWKKAEEAFRNMKKAREQASKPKMEAAVRRQGEKNQWEIDNKTAEDKRIEDLEDNQLKRNMEFEAKQEQPVYGYKQGDEALAFSKDWKEKKYENVKPVEVSPENKNIELDPNDPAQAELLQAITDFEAKQAQIAEIRAKKGGRWASLRKTLGLKEKNLDADPEVMVLEEEGKGLYRDLMAKGIHLYKGEKPQLENFLRQFDEFESFRNVRNQELDKKGEVAGFPENILAGLHTLTKKWSELGWKQKIAISVGGGLLFGGGAIALGAGTFGAASLGLAYRWGFRAFGAAAAGVGRNVMLDRQMMTEMQNEAEARLKERMDSIEKYEDNLDQGIEEMLSKSGISNVRKDFEQRRTANELRSLKFARNTFIISSIVGESLREVSQATGINVGSILSKIGEKTGISLAGVKETIGNFLSVSQANAKGGGMTGGSGGGIHGAHPEGKYGLGLYGTEGEGHGDIPKSTNERYGEGKYGPAGYGTENEGHGEITKSVDERYGHGRYGPSGHGTETEGHGDIPKSTNERYGYGKFGPLGGGTEAEGHDVVAAHPEGKYGPGLYGSEGEGHNLVDSHPEGKYGPGLRGSEGEGHNVVAAHPEGKYGPLGHGTEGEGHVPDMQELASVKIRSGGTMWGGIENQIKAHPSDYGLDPKAPGFTKDMHRMTKQMLDEFAYRKGMSYEDLDQIARTKLRAGDTFKIIYNPSTEEISLDDFHGKAFGADVPHGGGAGAAQEIAPSKPISSLEGGKLAPEDAVKPRTGAADHHHPSRGVGKTTQYEPDTPDQKIAKEDFAKADQYQKDLRAYNIKEAARLEAVNEVANSRLYLSTRGLLNQLVNGAGVGDKANFWGHSMDDWGKLLGSENYVAQDIRLTDEARVVSFDKLKGLYPILERYHRLGFETIGECLKEAVKDPKILRLIDVAVLKK